MFDRLHTILHVRIWKHRLQVTSLPQGKCFDEAPQLAIRHAGTDRQVIVAVGNGATAAARESGTVLVNPFDHPRTFLADFTCAEKVLQYAFREVQQGRWQMFAPRVIMHPMEELEGGLTRIEERALTELALGAGAREVLVWTGPEASLENPDFKALRAEAEARQWSRSR